MDAAAVSSLINKRKRVSKQRIPFSIPLDDTFTVGVNWSVLLGDLRRDYARRLQRRRIFQRQILNPSQIQAAVVPLVPRLGPISLRRVVGSVRFVGLTGAIQNRLNIQTERVRSFLRTAKPHQIARWWRNLYRMLPEPYFFLVYTTLQAVSE